MKNLLDIFLEYEESLIENSLKTTYDLNNQQGELKDDLIHEINVNLLVTTETNLALKSHKFFIDCLITTYLEDRFKNHGQLSQVFNIIDFN